MKINLEINQKNIDHDFRRIASELMNRWVLKVDSTEYEIAEIEFYFKSNIHNDKYTHGHILQKEKERWYFHGSGIDLTFGSNNFYGGILIRAIYDINSDNYIYGPLNCVTEIFSKIQSVYESKISFGLFPKERAKIKFEKPISAPRVGLNPKTDAEMIHGNYRYLVMPDKKHAEKTKIAASMKQQGYSEIEIKNIWG